MYRVNIFFKKIIFICINLLHNNAIYSDFYELLSLLRALSIDQPLRKV